MAVRLEGQRVDQRAGLGAVVAAFVVLVGSGVPLAYHAVPENGVISLFSIAGFQAMLVGFLIWFVFRTKYPTPWRQARQ